MGTVLFVATFLGIIFTVCVLVTVYWTTIMAQFATLPSDKTSSRSTPRRFEQTWIQAYLPNTASVLQIEGTIPAMINVQAKLMTDAQKEKHILLNSHIDAMDELVFMKDKDNLKTKLIHGVTADAGQPVSFLSRSYATTDYYGKIREPLEKYQEYTIAQLENLHGLRFDAVICENAFETTDQVESFLKQLSVPAVFFMFHLPRSAIADREQFRQMLLRYKLEIRRHHRGTWLCLPVPPAPESSASHPDAKMSTGSSK